MNPAAIRTIFAWTSIAVLSTALGATAQTGQLSAWSVIRSEDLGYSLAYPGSVFTLEQGRDPRDGAVLISRDGAARLLVGAFENDGEVTLAEYRELVLEKNYPGSLIDYAPMRRKWFVVSGTQATTMFYERVSFTCGGRLINSWAMVYPVAQRRFYDRVVEAIARTYKPGAGPKAACNQAAF